MKSYTLQFIPSDYYHKDNIRKIFLMSSIFLDIIAIISFFAAIILPIWWIAVVGTAFISNLVRYVVNLLPKKYIYSVSCNQLLINEITPLRSKHLISVSTDNIIGIKPVDVDDFKNNKSENSLILTDSSCYLQSYMIELCDKYIILGLDEYMYTLLKSKLVKDEHDILR